MKLNKWLIGLVTIIFPLLSWGNPCPNSLSFKGTLPLEVCVTNDLFVNNGEIYLPTKMIVPGHIIGNIKNKNKVALFSNNKDNLKVFSNPNLVNIMPINSSGTRLNNSLKNTFIYSLGFLSIVLAIYLILYKISWFYKFRIIKTPLAKNQILRELLMGGIGISITFFVIFYNESFLYLIPFNKLFNDWSLYPWWYHVLSFGLLMIIYDTCFFWLHYMFHESRFFYKVLHFVHHISVVPNPLTALNFHPIEIIFNYALLMTTSLFLPVHISIFQAFFIFHTLFDIYKHAGHQLIPIKIDRWLSEYLLIGPNYHEVHHTNGKYHLSFFFPYWDKITKRHFKKWEKTID